MHSTSTGLVGFMAFQKRMRKALNDAIKAGQTVTKRYILVTHYEAKSITSKVEDK